MHSGMKVWVTPPGKEPSHDEVLTEFGGHTECEVEEGSYKYHLRLPDQLQKQGSLRNVNASVILLRRHLYRYLCFFPIYLISINIYVDILKECS